VARQTRSQRRARRQAQQASGAASGAPPRARRPVADGAQEPHGEPSSQPHAHQEPERKGGPINFVRESWAELKKVEWPGQSQLVQGVVVVLLACLIVGAYLFAADQVFKRFVENVLLGQ
jgi:preprotein translocase subunit SecE